MTIQEAIKKSIEGGWKQYALDKFGEYTFLKVWQPTSIEYRYEVIREDGVNDYISIPEEEHIVLDPSFWQALGKVEGWGTEKDTEYIRKHAGNFVPMLAWKLRMHAMIDHLIKGGTIESYIETL
jgi:hypothetical protein